MNPTLKKALSAILFAVLGALLIAIQQKLVPLAPEALQATLVAALAGAAHYLDAWGHQDRVAAQVAAQAPKRSSVPPLVGLMLGCLLALVGCAAAMPILKPLDHAAVLLCGEYFMARKPGLSFEDVEKAFCTAAEDVEPFLAAARDAELKAGLQREAKASPDGGAR